MKASVLEFKLFEDVFCFNTEHIEYVFELESFNEVKGFYDAVVGVTRYNSDIMLLIDTAKLYSNKGLDFDKELSVIVIRDEKGMLYGMIVDEIIKLEELESVSASVNLNSDEMVINHYKDREADDIVNEIHPLPLLKKYAVPSMAKLILKSVDEDSQITLEAKTNYLLFKIAQSAYAIDSSYVKEVLENDLELFTLNDETQHIKGAIAVRDEVIPLVKLKESSSSNDIVVIENSGKKMAIEVDEVYDIENFSDAKVELLAESISAVSGFYNHNGDVVAIIDPHFYIKETKESLNESRVEQNSGVNEKLDYLIFMLDGKKYAIDMKCVRQVLETDSLTKTQSSSMVLSRDIAFIATWNRHAVNILKLDSLLDLEEENNNSQTIIIESNGHLVAFMVQDIDNIVYLDRDDVSCVAGEQQSLIKGAIIYNSEVIVTLNEAFLATLG